MRAAMIGLGMAGLLGLVVGCSDDSDAPARDAGVTDAALDASGSQIPRVDAQTGGQAALPFCDRFDANSCGPGEQCDEVIERDPAMTDFVIYTGCVEADSLRGEGEPCSPWVDRVPDIAQEVYYDQCGDGLVCGDDPEVRGSYSCQAVCQSGRFGDTPVACESPSAYCLAVGPFEETCLESDQCNVAAQTGCAKGEGCYLRVDDSGEGLLSVCLVAPPVTDVIDDHEPCEAINGCKPGSSCVGPLHLSAARWELSDYACRPTCTSVASGDDAGTDEDAGSSGDCAGAAECIPLAESGLSTAQIPNRPFGLCER